MADPVEITRAGMRSFRVPQPHDKVYRSECAFSFDTAESPGGLFVNLTTHVGFGPDFVQLDRERTGAAVYLHLREKRVPPPKAPEEVAAGAGASAPVKFGIGIEGGFAADSAKFVIERSPSVVVFTGPPGDTAAKWFSHPAETDALPSVVAAVVEGILAHTDVNAAEAHAAWEDKARPSKYAEHLEVRGSGAASGGRTLSCRPPP